MSDQKSAELTNMENLRVLRNNFRNFIKKNKIQHTPFIFGVDVFNNFDKNKELICDYFSGLGFKINYPTAPSPSGKKEGYTVYIISVVDNNDYDKQVALSISIHHEDENKVPKDFRSNYFY